MGRGFDMWQVYASKYQWKFFAGYSNEFDIFRVGLGWVDHKTVKIILAIIGFRLFVEIPVKSRFERNK